MIKVNLLRNLGATVSPAGTSISTATVVGADMQKEGLKKLLVILAGLTLVVAYERYNLSIKQGEIDALSAEAVALQAERQKYGDVTPIVEKYTIQKAKLEAQIKVLSTLTVNRLREVKLLDAIQSILPTKAWLREIHLEAGKVTMVGFAPTDQDVAELYKALEKNVLFSAVKVKTEETNGPGTGRVQKFEFGFLAGKLK